MYLFRNNLTGKVFFSSFSQWSYPTHMVSQPTPFLDYKFCDYAPSYRTFHTADYLDKILAEVR